MGVDSALHPTAQRLRCWVPCSLRLSAVCEGERYAPGVKTARS